MWNILSSISRHGVEELNGEITDEPEHVEQAFTATHEDMGLDDAMLQPSTPARTMSMMHSTLLRVQNPRHDVIFQDNMKRNL